MDLVSTVYQGYGKQITSILWIQSTSQILRLGALDLNSSKVRTQPKTIAGSRKFVHCNIFIWCFAYLVHSNQEIRRMLKIQQTDVESHRAL